jgi:serine/threonine-protein kinase
MSSPNAEQRRGLGQMVLGRYRVVRALASGGMGEVYLARAEGAAGFVKPVVIKRSLRAGGSISDQLFAREARILSSLRHPSVVGIVDFAEEDGDYIMVLDYVHGYTLQQWSRFVRKTRGAMPVELAVYVIRRMLDGLHYAHTLRDSNGSPLGIVHRDVKPSNVLIDVQGLVKLADFGVARTNTEVTDTTTGDATLKGTFAYMAPELFGKGTPSPASDVYSASVALYQLLAGRNPFATNDAVLTAARVLRHQPDPIDAVRDDVSPRLANVVHKGLCKHPEGRYRSALALAEALAEVYPETDDADDLFRTTVETDFNDPRLPAVLETDSLREREEAWSRFGDPGELPRRIALPLSPSELENTEVQAALRNGALADAAAAGGAATDGGVHTADTVLLGRQSLDPAPAPVAGSSEPTAGRGKRRSLLPVAIAVAAVGAGAAALLVGRGGDSEPEQTVVMVRGDVTMDEDQPASAAPGQPGEPGEPVAAQPVATVAGDPKEPSPAMRPSGATTADALTARFRKRQALISRCFDRYPEQATRAGKLAVRFHVDASGAVARAELLPSEVEGEPLGGCLLEVARRTSFGRQQEPLTFRIPISVRAQ